MKYLLPILTLILINLTVFSPSTLAFYEPPIDFDDQPTWVKQIGSDRDDNLHNVVINPDGSTMALLTSNSQPTLALLSPDGDVINVGRLANIGLPISMIHDQNYNYIVLSFNNRTLQVTRINHHNYNTQSRQYRISDNHVSRNFHYPRDITLSNDGGFAITGITTAYGHAIESFVIKISSIGNYEWSHVFGDDNRMADDYANAIYQSQDGSYYVTGYSHLYTDHHQRKIFLTKLDNDGKMLWNQYFYHQSDSSRNIAYDLLVDTDQNVLLTGISETNLFVYKLDSEGNQLWMRAVSSPAPRVYLGGLEYGARIIESYTGEYVIAGYARGAYSTQNPFVQGHVNAVAYQLTRDGDLSWSKMLVHTNQGSDQHREISIHQFQDVIETVEGGLLFAGNLTENLRRQGHGWVNDPRSVVLVHTSDEISLEDNYSLLPVHSEQFDIADEVVVERDLLVSRNIRQYQPIIAHTNIFSSNLTVDNFISNPDLIPPVVVLTNPTPNEFLEDIEVPREFTIEGLLLEQSTAESLEICIGNSRRFPQECEQSVMANITQIDNYQWQWSYEFREDDGLLEPGTRNYLNLRSADVYDNHTLDYEDFDYYNTYVLQVEN